MEPTSQGNRTTEQRLERLCAIYSLPFRLGWEEVTDPSRYNPYRYWRNLSLLTQEEHDRVFRDGVVRPSPLLHRYFTNLDAHFPPDLYHGGRVADIGSGFGFQTMWMQLSGAEHVLSIGDPQRIATVQRLHSAAVEHGLLPPGRLSCKPSFVGVGDTTLDPGVGAASLDLVVMNDTLEHITPRILPWLAAAAFHDLKSGGSLISRQQNTGSPSMLKRLRTTWERGEKEQFLAQRARLIKERVPAIAPEALAELARTTRGLDRPDFLAAVDRFADQGTYPAHDLDVAPVDVEIDVPHEGDTSIQRVTCVFREAGFRRVWVYPDLLPSRRSRWLQPLARLAPALFLQGHVFDDTTVFVIRK